MKKAALSLLDCFKYQSVYVNDRRKLKHSAPPVSELRPGIAEYGLSRVICNLSGIGRSGKAGNIRPETARISSLHSMSQRRAEHIKLSALPFSICVFSLLSQQVAKFANRNLC